MSENLIIGRCPHCGIVKDEMHMYVGRLAHEKVQLEGLIYKICTIPSTREQIDKHLTDGERETVLRIIENNLPERMK